MGTAVRCSCCGMESLAHYSPERGILEFHDRRHGIYHERELTLKEIVILMDPNGTTFRPI